jgi:hypothetical protein
MILKLPKKYFMIERKNNIFNIAVKKGIEMSKRGLFVSATKMMSKTGIPLTLIERVLYEPHNIRKND